MNKLIATVILIILLIAAAWILLAKGSNQASAAKNSLLYKELSSTKSLPLTKFLNLTTGGLGNMSELNISYAGSFNANFSIGSNKMKISMPLKISIARFQNSKSNMSRISFEVSNVPQSQSGASYLNESVVIIQNGTTHYICEGLSDGQNENYTCTLSPSISYALNKTGSYVIPVSITSVRSDSYNGNPSVYSSGYVILNSSQSENMFYILDMGGQAAQNLTMFYAMNVSPGYHIPYSVYLKFNISKSQNSNAPFGEVYIFLKETSMSKSTSASIVTLPGALLNLSSETGTGNRQTSAPSSASYQNESACTSLPNSPVSCSGLSYTNGNLSLEIGSLSSKTLYGVEIGFAFSNVSYSNHIPTEIYWGSNAPQSISNASEVILAENEFMPFYIPVYTAYSLQQNTYLNGTLWIAYTTNYTTQSCVNKLGAIAPGCSLAPIAQISAQ
ncbi:MAG: hypothetical protein ACP5RP_02395 [Candidatus Micrarchaeia archaeon]